MKQGYETWFVWPLPLPLYGYPVLVSTWPLYVAHQPSIPLPCSQSFSLPASLQVMGKYHHSCNYSSTLGLNYGLGWSQNHLPDLKKPLPSSSTVETRRLSCMWLNCSFASIFNDGLLHYYHRSPSLDPCNQNPRGGEGRVGTLWGLFRT